MKVSELKKALERMNDDAEFVIPVMLPNATMGGTPTVSVTQVFGGFDWDKGKVFASPSARLYPVGDEFLSARARVNEYSERIGFALNALTANLSDANRVKTAKQILSARIPPPPPRSKDRGDE